MIAYLTGLNGIRFPARDFAEAYLIELISFSLKSCPLPDCTQEFVCSKPLCVRLGI
jgi:hypothetical protein